MKISKIVEEKIKEKKMSIKSFAKIIDIPYTTFLGMLERGLAKADVQDFIKICQALGEKPEELIRLVYDDNYYSQYEEKKLKMKIREFGMPENILDSMNDEEKKKFLQALMELKKDKS